MVQRGSEVRLGMTVPRRLLLSVQLLIENLLIVALPRDTGVIDVYVMDQSDD